MAWPPGSVALVTTFVAIRQPARVSVAVNPRREVPRAISMKPCRVRDDKAEAYDETRKWR